MTSTDLENAIARSAPGRFCGTTLRTTARNVASTWTQSGHLHGHRVKRRSGAEPTAAAVAYSLLLGYLAGASGGMLLTTFWARLLDAPREHISSLAAEASARRWIEYRQAGQVLEVRFPDLLTPDELEMRREQD